MAQTPEAKVKKAVVKILKGNGVYYFFPATGGFGKSGVPDIVCCYRGHFLAIECKAGKNTTTKLQEINIEQIKAAGGTAIVINEDNIDTLIPLLQTL